MPVAQIIAWIILVLGLILAALGSIIPGLPGALFIFLAVVAHKLLLPEYFPAWVIWVTGALTVISWWVDFYGSSWGAKLGGATRAGVIGATIGAFVGIFFGVFGIVLGPFVGVLLGDLIAKRRRIADLLRSGAGVTFGLLATLILRFLILLAMAGVVVIEVVVHLWAGK